MNELSVARKGFRRRSATLPGVALFLSLFTLTPFGAALAQYIPPPASQTYAPAQGAATAAPPAATEEPRATRSTSRRNASSRARKVETVEEAAPTQRKARSTRRSRAEARAEARAAAREARAEAARSKTRGARAAAVARDDDDDGKKSPAADTGAKLVILAGQAQTTVARSAQELVDLSKAAGLDAEAKIGPVSLLQLNDADDSGADLAILQSDALEDAKRDGAGLQRKLTFIARLFNQEIHIVGRPGLRNFADLDGRTVASSAADSPEGRTAAKLFERAGIHPRLLEMEPMAALARVGRGEVDAAIFVGGKPTPALVSPPIAGLQLISIPYKGALQEFYYPSQITKADYPALAIGERGVDTVAISTVLVALDAKPGTPRFKKLTQFTQIFFERFGALRDGSHHPKWREVNLAADVPGWRRFQPAQKWLDTAPAPRISSMK